jgi:hypothetical protein
MGGCSVIKLVKPTNIASSWTPNQVGVDHLLLSQTESEIGTTSAGLLGKVDAAVRQKLSGLNSADRVLGQTSEFIALCVRDRGSQILNLNCTLANEHNLGNVADARHPRIANQLGIQSEQAVRFFRVATR